MTPDSSILPSYLAGFYARRLGREIRRAFRDPSLRAEFESWRKEHGSEGGDRDVDNPARLEVPENSRR